MIVKCDFLGESNQTQQMRAQRDAFLVASDWTQMLDAPLTDEQRQAWAVYRQQLRDFPATWTPAETAEFPDPPEAN